MNATNVFNSRLQTVVVLFLIGAFLSGCATIRSGAHHDESVSFDGYQSFSWIADDPMILGAGNQPPISALAKKEITQ